MGVLGGNIPPPRAKARSAGPPAAASLLVTPKRPRGGGVSDPVELFAMPIVGDPMLPMLPAVPHLCNCVRRVTFFYLFSSLQILSSCYNLKEFKSCRQICSNSSLRAIVGVTYNTGFDQKISNCTLIKICHKKSLSGLGNSLEPDSAKYLDPDL